ncbi:hypothetical protein KFL_000100180 [Klebsormidium nitens]|uniref:F-box domain-containing protein n=1 Tax=Klebsormidium nitens TaxID=105231 RepID=A0A1Y1HKT9_KLENI|nr:hypothetical protein KFL_000100180 [Klebsormidium nitens]|eukprot:GAQ78252.1 hypothetical protein KFL_000100180 [Klebsormidium nitens]
MADPCHLDRIPTDLLRDVLHRAAVRLDCTDGGLRALDEMRTCKNSRAEWAQVRELCRLQAVSKRFHQVASTVKNLHCRINPQAASRMLSGLATFLSKARCAEGLALTFGPKSTDPEDDWDDNGVRHPETQFSLCRTLAESQCFQELFIEAPCLQQFAVVRERFNRSEVLGQEMAADVELATNRLLEALSANCPRLSALALGCRIKLENEGTGCQQAP